jgi:hypothetical protein
VVGRRRRRPERGHRVALHGRRDLGGVVVGVDSAPAVVGGPWTIPAQAGKLGYTTTK